LQKAIGYIRVSTQGQAADGVNLAAQRGKIEAWCNLNDAELVTVFEDGRSGSIRDMCLYEKRDRPMPPPAD
jgi:site-specific DNA recombinase